jgi:hypothetical protein
MPQVRAGDGVRPPRSEVDGAGLVVAEHPVQAAGGEHRQVGERAERPIADEHVARSEGVVRADRLGHLV